MKENKAVVQEIWEINFVPEESKKFYHHKNSEKYTECERSVLYKKLYLNISQYSQENTCVGVSF